MLPAEPPLLDSLTTAAATVSTSTANSSNTTALAQQSLFESYSAATLPISSQPQPQYDDDRRPFNSTSITTTTSSATQPTNRFTPDEDKIIEQGLQKGMDWHQIIEWGQLNRTPRQVKARYDRILLSNAKRQMPPPPLNSSSSGTGSGGTVSSSSSLNNTQATPKKMKLCHHATISPALSPRDIPPFRLDAQIAVGEDNTSALLAAAGDGLDSWAPSRCSSAPPADADAENQTSLINNLPSGTQSPLTHCSPVKAHAKASPSPVKSMRRIEDYFVKVEKDGKKSQNSTNSISAADSSLKRQQQHFEAEIQELRRQLQMAESNNSKQHQRIQELVRENGQITNFYDDKLNDLHQKLVDKNALVKQVLTKLLTEKARQDMRNDRLKAHQEMLRLGGAVADPSEAGFRNFISEGWAFADIKRRLKSTAEEREEIDRQKKLLHKKKISGKSSMQSSSSDNPAAPDESEFLRPRPVLDVYDEDENLKMRLNILKKDESDLQSQLEQLAVERDLQLREMRRIRDEDQSQYLGNPVLGNRYLLQKLVGKGGFSEVYKAFDLAELREVACKIHSLNPNWGPEKKANYIKHSVREFRIHRTLAHPRIVKFFDIFEIDPNAFCIVLEYCPYSDLDQYLRLQPGRLLPEKEARWLVIQIVSALRYLNSIDPPVIHYDLKPGNILFGLDGIKLTDFGLSKLMEQVEEESQGGEAGIELTSQGAGTYWYLPPECFLNSPTKISSKVDVWSTGVIFYQMLYGMKPFGNDLSQYRILAENTIGKAYQVEFPAKPNVSTEAKEFIMRCLEYRKEMRPDVLTLAEDTYLRKKINHACI